MNFSMAMEAIEPSEETNHIKDFQRSSLDSRDVPLAKNPSTGMAQQRLFLVLKVVLHAVVVISEVLRLSTKSVAAVAAGTSLLDSRKGGL